MALANMFLCFSFFRNKKHPTKRTKRTPLLRAYLDSVGIPGFQERCNDAAAGSIILPEMILILHFLSSNHIKHWIKLLDQGGGNFWIHNTGPLGCFAHNVAEFGTDPFMISVKKLKGDFEDLIISYVDLYTIKYILTANYSQYVEQPIMTCCVVVGAPLNHNSRISCAEPCNDTSKYVNWDGIP
ncbi:GDSL esterase/lipase [Citrus sinensis]|nr:GDSL esterase/lipase [Citrus sinensis]